MTWETEPLISSDELVRRFAQLTPDAHCPFCGSTELTLDTDTTKGVPRLFAGTELLLQTNTETEQRMWRYPDKVFPQPMFRVVCRHCGYASFFDYQSVARQMNLPIGRKNGGH